MESHKGFFRGSFGFQVHLFFLHPRTAGEDEAAIMSCRETLAGEMLSASDENVGRRMNFKGWTTWRFKCWVLFKVFILNNLGKVFEIWSTFFVYRMFEDAN